MTLPPNHPDAPKYWLFETSGALVPVVRKYLESQALTDSEIAAMRAYLWQWVKSPVWGPSGLLEALRLRVAAIQTAEDINAALLAAEALGMDPL
jgi:hypothetical protein